ncbi:MAG: RluA family pseudouridine synthase [Ruminococcus sp.]|jgi:23S rRNA pseudouridine1911/1915/1917 synthase
MKNWIIFEDEKILVVHKPAGLAVQTRSFGQPDLESILKNYLKEKQRGGRDTVPYLGVIHRLDQPVEGLLVFGKTREAAKDLSLQSAGGQMEKRYLAVVSGRVQSEEEVFLSDYLVKDGKTHMARIAQPGEENAREARMSYRLLEQRSQEALVEIRLFTGRFHQIRVQMAHAGLPLTGDRKYNPEAGRGDLALCAYALVFRYPGSKKRMSFELSRTELKRYYEE